MKKKKKEDSSSTEDSPRVPFTQHIGRFLLTCGALFLILGLAVMLIPRTQGFRYSIEKKLTKQLGFPVSLEKVFINKQLNLVVEGARIGVSENSGQGGLSIDHALLDWSFPRLFFSRDRAIRSIDIKGCSLVFVQDKDGQWEPKPFSKLASFLDEWTGFKANTPTLVTSGSASTPTPEAKPPSESEQTKEETPKDSPLDHCLIRIAHGDISWRNPSGKVVALMEGFYFSYAPFQAPDRKIRHFRMLVDRAQSLKSPSMEKVDFEMMLARENKILLGFTAEKWGPPGIRVKNTHIIKPSETRFEAPVEAKLKKPEPEPGARDDEQSRLDMEKRIRKSLLESFNQEK